MRPDCIEEYFGQTHILGENTILRKVLEKNEVPSMILWGPPGCGKVSGTRVENQFEKDISVVVFITADLAHFSLFPDHFGAHHRQTLQTNANGAIRKTFGDNGGRERRQGSGQSGQERAEVPAKDHLVHGRDTSVQQTAAGNFDEIYVFFWFNQYVYKILFRSF